MRTLNPSCERLESKLSLSRTSVRRTHINKFDLCIALFGMCTLVLWTGRRVKIKYVAATLNQVALDFQQLQVFIERCAGYSGSFLRMFRRKTKFIAVHVGCKVKVQLQAVRRQVFIGSHPFFIGNGQEVPRKLRLVDLNPLLILNSRNNNLLLSLKMYKESAFFAVFSSRFPYLYIYYNKYFYIFQRSED